MKLSIVIPCYNEVKSIEAAIASVLAIASDDLEVEAVVVDDCSTDGSREILKKYVDANPRVRVLFHDVNQGKGAALKTGYAVVTGDVIGIHDADGEYDPKDYLRMIHQIQLGHADVVYGSRYAGSEGRTVLRHWHSKVNGFLTWFSNVMTDMELSDMETCYKLFKSDVLRQIAPNLREARFGFEPEITAYVARLFRAGKVRVVECPVYYAPRSFSQGKKIGWKDGVRALVCIVKYNLCRL